MLDFTTPSFAIAGLLAAAGPVLVHLLNRRRQRVVAWGAMEFLREALQRQRKRFELRDIVLLMLRMLAVMALGLGLSRPFWRGASIAPWPALIVAGLLFLAVAGVATAVIRRRLPVAVWCGIVGGLLAAALPLWVQSSNVVPGVAADPAVTSSGAVHAILLLDK